jgi:nucleoid DNA-binding protein
MATITKKELVDRIADRLNLPHTQVKRVAQCLFDEILAELVKGNRLEFRDFGVFECRRRPPRVAQNPRTLDNVHIPGKRRVRFKPGRLLKTQLGEPFAESEAQGRPQVELMQPAERVSLPARPGAKTDVPPLPGPSVSAPAS